MLTKLTNPQRHSQPREPYDDAIAFVEERRDALLRFLAATLTKHKRVTRSHVQRAVQYVANEGEGGESFDELLYLLVWRHVCLPADWSRQAYYDQNWHFKSFHLYQSNIETFLTSLETKTK